MSMQKFEHKKIESLPMDGQISSVTDLDEDSEMIIFESILTTFKASVVLKAGGTVAKICLTSKLNHHKQRKLA